MSSWVTRTVLSGTSVDPNGTNSHTCTFTAATSGNLLIAVIAGSVTSTTPTGWTLVKSAINSSGLYVFSKTASSGEASFSTTHNASNFPIRGVVYEFPSTSALVGVAGSAAGQNEATTGPSCTGLSGVYTRFAARCWDLSQTNSTSAATWVTPTVKDYDAYTPDTGSANGIALTIAYDDGSAGSSFTQVSTQSTANTGGLDGQIITFAVSSTATFPTPVYVQGNQTSDNTTGTSLSLGFARDINACALIVAAVSFDYSLVGDTASVTDTQGNVYQTAAGPATNTGLHFTDYIFYAIAGSTGSNTITVNFSTPVNFRRLLIHEYHAVNALDGSSSNTGASGAADSGTVSTNHANELIFGWGITNTGTTSAGSGFTLRQTALSQSTEDKYVTSTGSYNATYPDDGTAWICQVGAFYYTVTATVWLWGA